MTFRVTLRHSGLPDLRLDCGSDTPITEAALAAGWRLHVACERGGCGACRAVLQSGRLAYSEPVSERRRQGAQGECFELLCRALARSDLELQTVRPWAPLTPAPLSARLAAQPAAAKGSAPG